MLPVLETNISLPQITFEVDDYPASSSKVGYVHVERSLEGMFQRIPLIGWGTPSIPLIHRGGSDF